MSAVATIEGITTVSLPDLLAMRARAAKPQWRAARTHVARAGGHVSALRGRGMDYAESRIYQSGDDVRNVDWRCTARTGKWHTKVFQEEREQSLLLLMDTHDSMRFGTRVRYKSVAAARAAAWLAWTCVRGGDRVGSLAFGPVRAAVDPHPGARGALAVLGAMARWDETGRQLQVGAEHDEPLSLALERARRLLTPGSRAVLLSDGWCVDATAHTALLRLKRHVDLRVGILVDTLERDLAPAGAYVFETESGRGRVDLSGTGARAQFRDRLAGGWRRLAQACDAAGVAWTSLATDHEPNLALAPLWRTRGRRA